MKITTTRPKSIDCLEEAILQLADERRRAMPLLFDNIEQDISQKERFVVGQEKTMKEMQDSIFKLADYCWVLSFVGKQANSLSAMGSAFNSERSEQKRIHPHVTGAGEVCVQISFVAGTIKAIEKSKMERLLFRITRGKTLTHFSENFQQGKEQKVVYLVVYQHGSNIRDRVQKICDSFMGSRFEIPDIGDPLFTELSRVRKQI